MIKATIGLLAAILLINPVAAQEPEERKSESKATWAGGTSAQTGPVDPLAKRAAETAQSRRFDAFGGAESKMTEQTQETARRAAEIAQSRAAAPMVVNAAKATIVAAKPNIDGAKAAYEAELLEQFGFTSEAGAGDTDNALSPPGREASVVFASASIPLDTLRAYVTQLEGRPGALVFRGAPGGLKKIEPFARLARSILAVDPKCEELDCEMRSVPILIDPILFEANGVTKVPAVGLVRKDVFAQHCEDPEGIRATSAHITYGDAALSGHLEEHARLDQLAAATRDPSSLNRTGDVQ